MSKFILFCILMNYSILSFADSLTITIGRGEENYPPYEYREAGKLKGLHVEIIERVAMQMGMKIRFVEYPWKRTLQLMKNTEIDGVMFISKSKEREKYCHFIDGNTLSMSEMSFVTLKDRNTDEEKIKSVGVLLGYSYGTEFDQIEGIKRKSFLNMEKALYVLENKRIDAIITNKLEFMHIHKDEKIYKDLKFINPSVSTTKNYLCFTKGRHLEKLAKRFSDNLIKFKQSQEYKNIIYKYGGQTTK